MNKTYANAISGMAKRLARFEEVVREHEFRGTYPPEEIEEIERSYKRRKKAFRKYLLKLQRKAWGLPLTTRKPWSTTHKTNE